MNFKNWLKRLFVPAKQNDPSTSGRCKYCHKHVKGLESHIESKHKREKLA